jgi:hypothetical protein
LVASGGPAPVSSGRCAACRCAAKAANKCACALQVLQKAGIV